MTTHLSHDCPYDDGECDSRILVELEYTAPEPETYDYPGSPGGYDYVDHTPCQYNHPISQDEIDEVTTELILEIESLHHPKED